MEGAHLLNINSIEDARQEIEKVASCPEGIEIMAPKAIFKTIKLLSVRAPLANIIKQEMLAVGGDAAVSAGCVNCAHEKSDIILIGTLSQLSRFVEKMRKQPNESKQIAEKVNRLIIETE